MFVRHVSSTLLPALLVAAMGMGGETAADAGGKNIGENGDESVAASTLIPVMVDWEPEKIRELGSRLAELPDSVASAALWTIATAPPRVDTTQFYAMALSSPSPAIRRQAMDILAASDSADGMRLLTSLLIGERDPAAIAYIVAAIAGQPERRAVPALIAIILDEKTPSNVSPEVADRLRRLTRANISDSPTAWRNWWRDRGHFYE